MTKVWFSDVSHFLSFSTVSAKSSLSHCAGVKWQTLHQHQLARDGVGYRYAAKRRGARDRFPAWSAMDENRYFAMRKNLGGLAAEQQRRDAVAPMRSHDDKVAAFRSRGIDDRLVGTIILDLQGVARDAGSLCRVRGDAQRFTSLGRYRRNSYGRPARRVPSARNDRD